MMTRSAIATLIAILVLLPWVAPLPATAQEADSLAPLIGFRPFPTVGGLEAEDLRLSQLVGADSLPASLIQSPSATLLPSGGSFRPALRLFFPMAELTWNSDLPNSLNDGPIWAGRGANSQLLFGASLSVGPLFLVAAPQYVKEENRSYELAYEDIWRMDRDRFAPPWYLPPYSADIPLRLGADQRSGLRAGQLSATVRAGPIAGGVGTESQWWGPAIRNALVMSNNAPGIPHVFARTARALRTPIGAFEAKWMAGRLRESDFFDSVEANDHRMLSAAAVTLSPAGEPGLTLGITRAVYAARPANVPESHYLADVFTRWDMQGDVGSDTTETRGQLVSLFARWIFPNDGLEVYGEWARQRLPTSYADFLKYPGFSQAYTIGFQSARPLRIGPTIRIAAEVSQLEQTTRGRKPGSYYTSAGVVQGYTHEGQSIGAAIGPGSSSQWAAADVLGGRWNVGIFAERVRWDNDAYFRKPYGPREYYAHDVSLTGGVRLGVRLPFARVDATWGSAMRYNYLWQNDANSWANADQGVDVRNRTLRLVVHPTFAGAARFVRPAAVVPVTPPAEDASADGSLAPDSVEAAPHPIR